MATHTIKVLYADSKHVIRLVLTYLSHTVLMLYTYDELCIAFPEDAYSLFHSRLYTFLQSAPIVYLINQSLIQVLASAESFQFGFIFYAGKAGAVQVSACKVSVFKVSAGQICTG